MTDADRVALRRQLERHEGRRLKVYRCTAGYLTIGVGRNLEGRGITNDEADYLLDHDIDLCIAGLEARYAWFTGLDAVRQRAMVDLAFNLGLAGLATFRKCLAAMARTDYDAAANELHDSAWFTQVGVRGPRIVGMVRTGTEAA